MVQMMEILSLLRGLLCVYRGNSCATCGPAVFARSALTRRIFLLVRMKMQPVIREKRHENPSEKNRDFYNLHQH